MKQLIDTFLEWNIFSGEYDFDKTVNFAGSETVRKRLARLFTLEKARAFNVALRGFCYRIFLTWSTE